MESALLPFHIEFIRRIDKKILTASFPDKIINSGFDDPEASLDILIFQPAENHNTLLSLHHLDILSESA
jgi:hypothetical protein